MWVICEHFVDTNFSDFCKKPFKYNTGYRQMYDFFCEQLMYTEICWDTK